MYFPRSTPQWYSIAAIGCTGSKRAQVAWSGRHWNAATRIYSCLIISIQVSMANGRKFKGRMRWGDNIQLRCPKSRPWQTEPISVTESNWECQISASKRREYSISQRRYLLCRGSRWWRDQGPIRTWQWPALPRYACPSPGLLLRGCQWILF